jgi:hypothetical protein
MRLLSNRHDNGETSRPLATGWDPATWPLPGAPALLPTRLSLAHNNLHPPSPLMGDPSPALSGRFYRFFGHRLDPRPEGRGGAGALAVRADAGFPYWGSVHKISACCFCMASASNWAWCMSEGRPKSTIAILSFCFDTKIQSGCRLPNRSISLSVRMDAQRTSPVLASRVSTNNTLRSKNK